MLRIGKKSKYILIFPNPIQDDKGKYINNLGDKFSIKMPSYQQKNSHGRLISTMRLVIIVVYHIYIKSRLKSEPWSLSISLQQHRHRASMEVRY